MPAGGSAIAACAFCSLVLVKRLSMHLLQRVDTLVLLMGGSTLGLVMQRLMEHGKPDATPVSVPLLLKRHSNPQAMGHSCPFACVSLLSPPPAYNVFRGLPQGAKRLASPLRITPFVRK
jgi:hypothetical protein